MNKFKIDSGFGYDFSPLAEAVYKELKQKAGIKAEIVFLSGDEIQKLNRETRNTDKITDVLSFPTLDNIKGEILNAKNYPFDTDEDKNIFIGSVAICKEIALRQAEEYGHSEEREIFYLAAHGLLHLLGYDHATDPDKEEMRELEEKLMDKLKLKRSVQ